MNSIFMTERIAVIIPNLHSPIIDRVLESLETQTKSIDEVIVVGLDRHNLIKTTPKVRFISTGQPVSPAEARNIGMANSSADIFSWPCRWFV